MMVLLRHGAAVGLAASAFGWLPSPTQASLERELVVTPRVVLGSSSSKLAADLQAVVISGGTYVGVTETGRAVVRPRGEVTLQAMVDRLTSADGRLENPKSPVTTLREVIVTYSFEPPDNLDIAGAQIARRSPFGRSIVVRAADGLTAPLLESLAGRPWVTHVEPNYPYRLFGQRGSTGPDLSKQWGVLRVRADQVWPTIPEAAPLIALLDSGVDSTHPDLLGQIDPNSFDFITNSSTVQDPFGHGTHCAGIIGGAGDGGQGTFGVALKAHILSLRIFDDNGEFAPADRVADAIDYALAHRARVISASWGGPNLADKVSQALKRAIAAQVLVVASVGNTNLNLDDPANTMFPAMYPSNQVIAVMATGKDDKIALFRTNDRSNYGHMAVHIGAPGVDIRTTERNGGYGPEEGSSMAAPFVTAASALLWTISPNLGPADIRLQILSHARRVPSLAGRSTTGGVLDMSFLASPVPVPPMAAMPPAGGRGGSRGGGTASSTGAAQEPITTPETWTWTGMVSYGVMAIGGETTGIVLTTGTDRFELRPATNSIGIQLREMDGRAVTVKGILATRQGVEVTERKILTVSLVMLR
jgi:hypothetical protein